MLFGNDYMIFNRKIQEVIWWDVAINELKWKLNLHEKVLFYI